MNLDAAKTALASLFHRPTAADSVPDQGASQVREVVEPGQQRDEEMDRMVALARLAATCLTPRGEVAGLADFMMPGPGQSNLPTVDQFLRRGMMMRDPLDPAWRQPIMPFV